MSRSFPPPPTDPEAGRNGGRGAYANGVTPMPREADPYDALADLFLGEDEAKDPGGPVGSREEAAEPGPRGSGEEGVAIEGVLMGHLPVTGVAWANQYARHVAEERGELVGVVKLVAGQGAVELVGPGAVGLEAELGEPVRTLGEAVRKASRWASRWLIRVDEPAEHALMVAGAVDSLTLLTGADEAAVVASYRTLKSLSEETGADLGLALMGAPAERAEEVSAKLVRAAETFLGRSVRVTACVTKIGPGRTLVLFRGPIEDAAELVVEIGREIRRGGTPRPGTPVPVAAARPEEILAGPRIGSGASHAGPAMPEAGAKVGGAARLTEHVTGLRPLRAACPYAPGVELAVGAGGELHVLASGAGGQEREAVERLLAAAAWAGDHAELLRLTGPEAAAVRVDAKPVMHLFAGDARAVRRLLDSGLRVHLLVRAEVDGRAVWACADLN